MLVELSDTAINVLRDAVMRAINDSILDCLSKQHILIGVRLQHPLEEQGSPLLLQLCPVLLAGLVELITVGYVPHWLDVQRIHHVGAAPVHATVVKEEIDLVVVAH